MPRLIDADALMLAVEKDFEGVCVYDVPPSEAVSDFERIVDSLPTIDAEPVRHGRWIHTTKEDSDWGGTFHRYTCSACNWSMGDNPTGWGLFCLRCGAKMDLEVRDD